MQVQVGKETADKFHIYYETPNGRMSGQVPFSNIQMGMHHYISAYLRLWKLAESVQQYEAASEKLTAFLSSKPKDANGNVVLTSEEMTSLIEDSFKADVPKPKPAPKALEEAPKAKPKKRGPKKKKATKPEMEEEPVNDGPEESGDDSGE